MRKHIHCVPLSDLCQKQAARGTGGKKRGGLRSRTSIPFARVAPQNGSIRCMIVTEKQYAGMRLIAGKRAPDEKPVEYIRLSFL